MARRALTESDCKFRGADGYAVPANYSVKAISSRTLFYSQTLSAFSGLFECDGALANRLQAIDYPTAEQPGPAK